MGIWNWLFGGKEDLSPNMEFQEKERVEPTLHMPKSGVTIGQLEIVDGDLIRWTDVGWKFVCRIPKPDEVKSPADLPAEATMGYCYAIAGDTWCWDGACWVNNSKIQPTVHGERRNTGRAIPVTPPVRQVTQRRDLGSDHRISDPHPTDNGAVFTAVVLSQIMDADYARPTPTPSGGSSYIGSSSSHSRHDDSPSHHSPSHDTHHTPSSDYGSDFGGGSFD